MNTYDYEYTRLFAAVHPQKEEAAEGKEKI